MRNAYKILAGISNEKKIRKLQKDGRIIFKRLLNRTRGCGLDSSEPGYGQLTRFCDDRNELSISIIRRKDISQTLQYKGRPVIFLKVISG
jgi:hypothetical protein